MSLNNFKKNISRVGQRLNEKVAGYKGTQKGENYKLMTDQVDLYKKHLDELSSKTVEVLQPNPAIRAKMGAIDTFAKLRGTQSGSVYKQSEAELAEIMNKHGNALGSQSSYGRALLDAGSAFIDVADLKYSNEDNIRELFLGPINSFLSQDIKEINALRRKCESRRLDYDTERKSFEKSQKPDEMALRDAQTRYEESMENASVAMANFLNSEHEHIVNLDHMVKSMMDYHAEASKVLAQLHQNLQKRKLASQEQTGRYNAYTHDMPFSQPYGSGSSPIMQRSSMGPCCRALYPFKAENENELEFEQDEVIKLIEQVDMNWFLGELRGRRGHFPINYVEVMHPLP